MLSIKNLHVSVEDKKILNGISFDVKPGEVHVIMGPNGSGKSTLSYSIMGHPVYDVGEGSCVMLNNKHMFDLSADERAREGLFLAFQQPIAVSGITVRKFLRHIGKRNNKSKKVSVAEAVKVNKRIDALAEELSINPELLDRDLNDNFSGGEKKKIETLQMMFLSPKFAIMDEIDTGLDVDALRIVAKGITKLAKKETGFIVITHYQRILKHVKPDYVHVMKNGKIVKSGTARLAKEIEEKGYSSI